VRELEDYYITILEIVVIQIICAPTRRSRAWCGDGREVMSPPSRDSRRPAGSYRSMYVVSMSAMCFACGA
jgi:hypothetical protein